MNIIQKTRIVAATVLSIALLAGCTSAPASDSAGIASTDGVSNSADQAVPTATPAALTSEEAFIDKMKNGDVAVTVLEVIDQKTFRVGPNEHERDINGFTGEAVVTTNPESLLVTPAEGECGHDEAVSFAKQYFAETPDGPSVEVGNFTDSRYPLELIGAGFAYIPNWSHDAAGAQEGAKFASTGLYGTCPGFGEFVEF